MPAPDEHPLPPEGVEIPPLDRTEVMQAERFRQRKAAIAARFLLNHAPALLGDGSTPVAWEADHRATARKLERAIRSALDYLDGYFRLRDVRGQMEQVDR